MRVRVPRRGTVAEQPVVARKSRNGDGAKGFIDRLYLMVNQQWEEPLSKAGPDYFG
jgi:hypothetical protein